MNIRNDRRSMFFEADSKTFELARRMRKMMTPAELILWMQLKRREIFKVKFRRQHPAGRYILDFYCHEYKLAVEVDGEIHENEETHNSELNREAELERLGIKVLRFINDEVIEDIDLVISKIQHEINFQHESKVKEPSGKIPPSGGQGVSGPSSYTLVQLYALASWWQISQCNNLLNFSLMTSLVRLFWLIPFSMFKSFIFEVVYYSLQKIDQSLSLGFFTYVPCFFISSFVRSLYLSPDSE